MESIVFLSSFIQKKNPYFLTPDLLASGVHEQPVIFFFTMLQVLTEMFHMYFILFEFSIKTMLRHTYCISHYKCRMNCVVGRKAVARCWLQKLFRSYFPHVLCWFCMPKKHSPSIRPWNVKPDWDKADKTPLHSMFFKVLDFVKVCLHSQ